MKEMVHIRIQEDEKHFYLQYGGGAEWEKYKKSDLPWGIRAMFNTFMSDEYEADIIPEKSR